MINREAIIGYPNIQAHGTRGDTQPSCLVCRMQGSI